MKLYASLLLCLFTFSAVASQKAVTDEGDVVLLSSDGTWTYESGDITSDLVMPINPTPFKTPIDSNFVLKSTKTNASFTINPKLWKFKKNDNGHDSAEYTFELKGTDLYGMVISEEIEIDLEELAKIALSNAKDAAPDAKLVKQEYRTVNGKRVIYLEIQGTMSGMKFSYLGYYYSDASGSTQFLAYTGTNLVGKYRSDIDNFLNGFTVD